MRHLATREQFPLVTEPKKGMRVHIEGWAKGAVFTIVDLNDSEATIHAPKSKQTYKVHTNMLLHTNANRKDK